MISWWDLSCLKITQLFNKYCSTYFLPGESQGWGSLVGCRLWGRTESDTTEATYQQQQQLNIFNKYGSTMKLSLTSWDVSWTVLTCFSCKHKLGHGLNFHERTQIIRNIIYRQKKSWGTEDFGWIMFHEHDITFNFALIGYFVRLFFFFF